MTIHVEATPYGLPAAEALRRALAEAKAGDPLAPATVLVPRNDVGLSMRRLLGSGRLGPVCGSAPGIVAVAFTTVGRLAEQLGAPSLAAAGRRPVSVPVLASAVRAALAEDPGVFAGVEHHQATEQALVDATAELADLSEAELDRLAASSRRAADVVRVHRACRRRLVGEWYDEHDLFDAAVAALATPAATGDASSTGTGPVVLYLPARIGQAAGRFLRALARDRPLTAVIGCTGDERADARGRELAERLGATLAAPSGAGRRPAERVVSCSDPDDEVRAAVREVVAAVHAGTPLERLAIAWPADEPYARIVHDQLAAAGIARCGPTATPLAARAFGRALTDLLALGDRAFRRDDVAALLASGLVRVDRRRAPAAAWERVSRLAGVVRGTDEWSRHLERFAAERDAEREAESAGDDRDWLVARLEREAGHARGLARFVGELHATLADAARPAPWADRVRWTHRLIDRWFGGDAVRTGWPVEEIEAAERTEAALDRLAGLDRVSGPVDLATFRRTLELELDARSGRVGSFGEGVLVGRLGSLVGVHVERLWVLGAAEGTLPGAGRDDPLLPDRERDALGGALPLRAERVDHQHHDLLAVTAGAEGERVLLWPRGDLRRSSMRQPSRWVLAALGDDPPQVAPNGAEPNDTASNGTEPNGAASSGTVRPAADEEVPSFAAGLVAAPAWVDGRELRLAHLFAHHRAGRPVDDHPLLGDDAVARRGLTMLRARASNGFTRFDGNLAGIDRSGQRGLGVVAPTRLETFARCPLRFLYEVLGRVEVPERPEEVLSVTALDRGTVIHRALDRFLAEVLARPTDERPGPGEPWTTADRARLAEIAREECDELEQRGVTGARVLWSQQRARIVRELDELTDRDDDRRREAGLAPAATEAAFGPGADQPPVEVALDGGRIVAFRGSADRIDVGAEVVTVVDYKTGSGSDLRDKELAADPVLGGTRLQLPVYALAAREATGRAGAPVDASYWYVSERANFRRSGFRVDDAVLARFREAVSAIMGSIDAGHFPARPAEPQWRPFVECPFCDPDGLGTRERHARWEQVRRAPELARFVGLVEPAVALELAGGAS
ncbi:MAG: PD-(D/E)XK nuclease family protein [Actinomycetota bacterium]|nr:PD-(D/E)XK nuclease family protein [Actinomycetota bacterium]